MVKTMTGRTTMTAKYELYDHTADLGVIGHGPSLAEALEGVLQAMFDKMSEVKTVGESERQRISAQREGLDLEDMIVDLLSQVLYLFDAEGFLGKRSEVEVLEEENEVAALEASLFGETFDPSRHSVHSHIKAVTYHDLKVWQDQSGWHVKILFDV